MDIVSSKRNLHGAITVPGSKSHTIRALLLAALADGTSHIFNPLPSDDCLSASRAIELIGADFHSSDSVWTVFGAGSRAHLPDDVVDVGNSGSLLYFLSPIAATFSGWSVLTGDASIRKRPVSHVVDALKQLGCEAYVSRPDTDAPPLIIRGPISKRNVVTDGSLSQYVSGMMMAASRLSGTLDITLANPKETPYLSMTRLWLEELGIKVSVSDDFKRISVRGGFGLPHFDKTIPSDWEALAFPLVAALISDSEIIINNIDDSGSQGDDAIVEVLESVGADIERDRVRHTLTVRGGTCTRAAKGAVPGRLSTENLPHGELRVPVSNFPDAICSLAVAASFIEGTTIIEDVGVCRKKETDRVEVMRSELTKLGVEIEAEADCLVIHGHAPLTASGEKNYACTLHGGTVETYGDHRAAMALSCFGFGLPEGEAVRVKDAECSAVSFPGFIDAMNGIGAGFVV